MRLLQVVRVDGTPTSVRALSQALSAALGGGPPVLPAGPGADALVVAMRPDDPVPEPAALLVATSGSSGEPKGVLLSAAALTASAGATHVRLGGPGRWLLATPAQYIGGLQVLTRSLLSGFEPGVVDLSTGFRPEGFAAAADGVLAAPGPHYTALVPTQLVRLLDAGGAALAALQAFDAVVIGGAALPSDVRARAADAGVRVVRAYGMSETCGGCVYDGRPLDGVQVRVNAEFGTLDVPNATLGTSPEGRIELAGQMLALRYRHGELPVVDSWFQTDDLGRLGDDGRLEVLGRADDVINSGGVKVPAAAVEQVLRRVDGVRAVCVVGVPDPEWGEVVAALVVATDAARPPSTVDLQAAARRAAGRAAAPRIVHLVEELPMRGPGKVDRAAVRRMLQTGEAFTS